MFRVIAFMIFVLFATSVNADTINNIRLKQYVTCGISTGIAGFSYQNSSGKWEGFDIDRCRALSAAIFGNPDQVKFVSTTTVQKIIALQNNEVDVILRNNTQTFTRDTGLGILTTGIYFYDGQSFLVHKNLNVKTVADLNGATICVQPGTTTEMNLANYFRNNNLQYKLLVIERLEELLQAYNTARCDAFTSDSSQLAGILSTQIKDPQNHIILPNTISKEPLGPLVRQDDINWYRLVKWLDMALIEAEERGITSINIDTFKDSKDLEIRKLLGFSKGIGSNLGLNDKWFYNVIKSIGNYGEIYDRHFGEKSKLKLDRGLNKLWTNNGLIYSMPFR